MKSLNLIIFLFALSIVGYAQETIYEDIVHDGLDREYIIYIPANYTGDTPVPLVFNYHGFGSNGTQQLFYGDFRSIADTAGFILVHPEGTLLAGVTHWNVGGWTVGSTVDDVGFTTAMIDEISASYNINADRVYATGMSNGGFMSFVLACQLSDKIAAIASVTGSMTPETYDECNPQRPVPVMQIHGTDDSVVPYNGATWTRSVEDAVAYWVDFNNCNETAVESSMPDTNTGDGSTVDYYVYGEGDNGATTEHFKITGGDHTWPGSAIPSAGTNYDIDASFEIWKFFSRYDINGLLMTTTSLDPIDVTNVRVYPTITSSIITIENDFTTAVPYEVVSLLGNRVMTGMVNSTQQQIDLSALSANVYLVKVGDKVLKVVKAK